MASRKRMITAVLTLLILLGAIWVPIASAAECKHSRLEHRGDLPVYSYTRCGDKNHWEHIHDGFTCLDCGIKIDVERSRNQREHDGYWRYVGSGEDSDIWAFTCGFCGYQRVRNVLDIGADYPNRMFLLEYSA